jgi:DNA replicative helicase MCM subunit Mcm2 (Cdc46/Mcm family)
MTQEEEYGSYLRFVTLGDDNLTLLLNGEVRYSIPLPRNIFRKNAAGKMEILQKRIFDGCDKFHHDPGSEENVRNLSKEILDQLYERPRQIKTATVSDIIRMNNGRVMTTAKIVGVSPPYKMIEAEILECPECGQTSIREFESPCGLYKVPQKKCPLKCLSGRNDVDQVDLVAHFEYVNARSVTVQDPESTEDLEKLHVILFEDYGRNVKVGEIATIIGEAHVTNDVSTDGKGSKQGYSILYASHIKYKREEQKPITEEDIVEFKVLAEQPNVIDQLVEKFARQVIGHSDAKLGILRSAVNVRETKHLTGIRSRTHTNLAGDPGTAKSMLAIEATKIVPNSRYVTAQHASIKSVLAIIEKELDGSKMLMLGAVPQSRNAICSINEIGSMPFQDQQHLADILEEGRFTIEKYGIYQEIDSPTTVIATTNPDGGYWSRSLSPSLDQLPIKSNIRDRFDQTYIFEDFQTPEERREYAMSKAEIYQDPQSVKVNYDFLKRYLQYASSLADPVLTPEAGTMLSDFWIRMSEQGLASNRSFDSLIRIARGQARLHLKEEIDAQIASEVMKDVHLMFVKMGRRVDPTVEDPRDVTYYEIIQFANTLEVPITFLEAAKHVYANNNSIKQYLGGDKAKWSIGDNKRLRHVHDKFSDGAVAGKIKIGRGGLAVKITNTNPLTIVKTEVRESESRESSGQVSQVGQTNRGEVSIVDQFDRDHRDDSKLLKCPSCNFKNIHQESIEHHVKYKHNNNEGEGELTTG